MTIRLRRWSNALLRWTRMADKSKKPTNETCVQADVISQTTVRALSLPRGSTNLLAHIGGR